MIIYSDAHAEQFINKLCRFPEKFDCVRIKVPRNRKLKYYMWQELFPKNQLRTAMALNRRNTLIWHNHLVAIPRSYNYMDYAPFPAMSYIIYDHIVVDLNVLAWGAYRYGRLINWGPANGGSKRCKETGLMRCKTHPGAHQILRLYGPRKRSDLYPVNCMNKKICGHLMPYYMPFHRDGTGLHGDKWLTGKNMSHGCVRLLRKDARWLNKNFARIGTEIIIRNY